MAPVRTGPFRRPELRLLCGALGLTATAWVRTSAQEPLLAKPLLRSLRRRSLTTSRSLSEVGETAHILSIATEYRQEAVILQRTAKLLGYRFQFCGFRERWAGWFTKLVQYQKELQAGLASGRIAQTDPVLLIDGWDCVLVGPASEFIAKMSAAPFSTSQPWYAGERICGPDFFKANRIDAVYPDPGTPWRYPNAGCMTGRAEPVLELIDELLAGAGDGETLPEDGDDQGRLHEHLLELGERGDRLPYFVDSTCRIFQCLYEAEAQWTLEDARPGELLPRLRNRQTGEEPIVLHGNGHTGRWFMSNLWREMDFLRRVGLTTEELAHLPYDGPVAPGTVPDEATEKNWMATFQLYRIIEKQMAYARVGIEWDPWKLAAQQNATM
ncbi:2-oxoglutarate 5-dioxygenase 3 (Lysyl hydroxylase 3) (LH3) [Durusdinium trenchii]|uniref:2-oxoglutarate 5-dioxygenase 3 (Lysyl hydroxylase 3) (LH3) n=1 Tax=Durusdinium trenchii TaxID=1381693 RepID=A0ABP0KKD2_9DINO